MAGSAWHRTQPLMTRTDAYARHSRAGGAGSEGSGGAPAAAAEHCWQCRLSRLCAQMVRSRILRLSTQCTLSWPRTGSPAPPHHLVSTHACRVAACPRMSSMAAPGAL